MSISLFPQEKWFTNLETKGNTEIGIYLRNFFAKFFWRTRLDKVLCYIPESRRFPGCFMLYSKIGQWEINDIPQRDFNSKIFHEQLTKVVYAEGGGNVRNGG